MSISIGFVGVGSFAEGFIPLFKSHPLVDRVALCDILPDRLAGRARQFQVAETYPSLEQMCKSDLDALVIMTQPWLHAPQAIMALEAGKHCYSAVPVISLPDGDEMLDWCGKLIEARQRTGMHYMLGETTCYRPEAMYCRRRAAEGAFGQFVYSEGEYLHAFDLPSCDLREVQAHRTAGGSGREWLKQSEKYRRRGIRSGPMHYPTHSVSGPISVMKARAVKVCAWGYAPRTDDAFFAGEPFSNETALFQMSNGATMRICEHREIGFVGRESFRLYGTGGSFEHSQWVDKAGRTSLRVEQMRDRLPPEVEGAFRRSMAAGGSPYGGHGGSHAFLVHEFVDAIAAGRTPAIDVHEAARYMAAGVTAHKSALRDGEVLDVPDFGDARG